MNRMKSTVKRLTERPAWKAVAAHYKRVRKLHLRDLFAKDAKRGERMTAESVGLFLDYSKNRVTDQTLKLLFRLAKESRLVQRREQTQPRQLDQQPDSPLPQNEIDAIDVKSAARNESL
jgi:hypothetical protein